MPFAVLLYDHEGLSVQITKHTSERNMPNLGDIEKTTKVHIIIIASIV